MRHSTRAPDARALTSLRQWANHATRRGKDAGPLDLAGLNVDVRSSHDHVGTPRLRQQSRTADVIVLATRCATHAATGFIRANAASTALVAEADGSGSASLLRAAIAALR